MDSEFSERQRQVWVRVDDDTYGRFRGLCARNGKSVMDALGDGMREAVAGERRRKR